MTKFDFKTITQEIMTLRFDAIAQKYLKKFFFPKLIITWMNQDVLLELIDHLKLYSMFARNQIR